MMFMLIYPLLIGILVIPDPGPGQANLADFSRMRSAVLESVYVVDQNGHERLMTLLEATDDTLTLGLGPQTLLMARDAVLRVDRERDRTTDGVLKGLAFGLVVGLLAQQGLGSSSGRIVVQSTLLYGGIGYLLDRANSHRAPLYRVPGASASVTVRF